MRVTCTCCVVVFQFLSLLASVQSQSEGHHLLLYPSQAIKLMLDAVPDLLPHTRHSHEDSGAHLLVGKREREKGENVED